MPDTATFLLFLATAVGLAVLPGPGILYVAARTLAGGRGEGLASSFGTGLGGFVHVAAGALGVSALVVASAEAFTVLKLVGAAYLVWIGVRTLRAAREAATAGSAPAPARTGVSRAFRDGALVEALNPKTAAFFLALLPQFVDPAGDVALQFVLLGAICVALNTAADVVVVFAAVSARRGLGARPGLVRRLQQGSGVLLCGLGLSLALARRSS